MAKIRGVKPEFWTDDAIVELSPLARLLYIGLWNYACDNGHVENRPKQLKLRILPGDDCDIEELLDELESSDRISRTDAWITIPNLAEHQKPNRRYWLTCENAGCERPLDSGAKLRTRGEQTSASGRKVAQRGAPVDGDGDGDGDGEVITSAAADERARFSEFYEIYPRREGRGQAARAWKSAIKKTDADTIISAIRSQLPELKRTERRFVKLPATWLNGECWDDENITVSDEHPYAHLPAPKDWDAIRAEAEASRGGAS